MDEFCASCGCHLKSIPRLLGRLLRSPDTRGRPGPQRFYEPDVLLPVLKAIRVESDQQCSKVLQAVLPRWMEHYERKRGFLGEGVKARLLAISPAQIDRLLRLARLGHTRKGPGVTWPATVLVDTVALCDNTTEEDCSIASLSMIFSVDGQRTGRSGIGAAIPFSSM